MDYSTLEDVWGVKTFETPAPALAGGWEPENSSRPPDAVRNPVASVYFAQGVDGVLRSLPAHAIADLRARFGGTGGGPALHMVAAVLLCGFVLLIMWDVLTRTRAALR